MDQIRADGKTGPPGTKTIRTGGGGGKGDGGGKKG